MSRIKELRNKKFINQTRLASELHVSQQKISQLEQGICLPSRELAVALSKYFNVSTDYIYGISDDPYIKIKSYRTKDRAEYAEDKKFFQDYLKLSDNRKYEIRYFVDYFYNHPID